MKLGVHDMPETWRALPFRFARARFADSLELGSDDGALDGRALPALLTGLLAGAESEWRKRMPRFNPPRLPRTASRRHRWKPLNALHR